MTNTKIVPIGITAVAFSITLLPGCASKSSLKIFEPRPARMVTQTCAPRVAYAHDDSATRLVIDCPLPGSKHGKPYGTIYLVLPDITGSFDFENASPGKGIYVQHNGAHAGWTQIQQGHLHWKPRFLGLGRRKATIDIRTNDTTRITGTFSANPDDRRVRQFERRHTQFIQSFNPAP